MTDLDLDALERLPERLRARVQQGQATIAECVAGLREADAENATAGTPTQFADDVCPSCTSIRDDVPLLTEAADAFDALLARLRATDQERDGLKEQLTALTLGPWWRTKQSIWNRVRKTEAERDVLQARVTELEAQPPQPDLAVDLAALLNLHGAQVADALLELGYRLTVERDPSAAAKAKAEAVR